MSDEMIAKKGLEGLIADDSAVSYVDLSINRLVYRGYDVNELCAKCRFLEVAYLLLHGELPTPLQLSEFEKFERKNREVPPPVYAALKKIPRSAHPMDVLRAAVSLAALDDRKNSLDDNNTAEANLRKAKLLFAKMPALVANGFRLTHGKPAVKPNPRLGYTENFLAMLLGKKELHPYAVKTFDVTLILYAEHGFNASTFSARVTASTLSDFYSAIASAIGTLKGPLHGGANEQVMYMLKEIGTPDKADQYVKDALAQKKKLMGFGHRLYRTGDSRTPIIKKMGRELAEKLNDTRWHDIADRAEAAMAREKNIFPNLDYPVATAYYVMGLPIDTYTPIFAASRVTGWAAHIIEQHKGNRLIRPSSRYVGPALRTVAPLTERL